MSNDIKHVVVVGGGVIGALTAWYVVKSGRTVTIVDRDKFGAACSHGNCGYVSPSHALPLPKPGAVKYTISTLLKSNSPLSIKFPPSLELAKWLWNFQKRCNRRDMLEAAAARSDLLQASMQLYEELIESERLECEWKRHGLLFVFATEKEFEQYGETDELLRTHFNVPAHRYDATELIELEPSLKPGLGGAWHYEGDRHLRPDKLMSALRNLLESNGVKILENFSADIFVREGKLASAVADNKEPGEPVIADAFVVATGAMTPFLNDQLGCRIPIQPGKGYSLTMACPETMPKYPMIFEEHRVGVTPMESGYRLGSMMEFVGYDDTIRSSRLQVLRDSAAVYLHDPYCDPVEEEWFGWRPMTWDGKPIIDKCPAFENVWIAAGHNMLGLSMGAGTGKLISQLIANEIPVIDPGPFSISRFKA